MTPEQILADLRDIHLPELQADATSSGLVLWPLAVVAMAAVVVAWVIWRRQSMWRRDVTLHLDQIEKVTMHSDLKKSWEQLAHLLRRLAIQRQNKSDVARLSGEGWLAHLDNLIDDDLFTNGPGRGLIRFPYLGETSDQDLAERMHLDLLTTIKTLRKKLPSLGLAR